MHFLPAEEILRLVKYEKDKLPESFLALRSEWKKVSVVLRVCGYTIERIVRGSDGTYYDLWVKTDDE